MKEQSLIEVSKRLAYITIEKHKQKLLGKENMSAFIKNYLNKDITEEHYNKILHLYSKYLSKEGYEIRKNITKFDIINYNSEEYKEYINK